MTRTRLHAAVFIVIATACAAWAIYNLRPLKGLFGFGDYGGGGIFRLTTSVDALQYVLAPLIAFAISRRLRASAGFAQRLRRAHVAVTLIIAGAIAVFVVATALGNFMHGVDSVWVVLLAVAFIGEALWLPLQTFFAASFVGILIIERRPGA
jgi:hypothetical protein